MKTSHLVHISLGSNIGDRIDFLQKGVDAIFESIGDVIAISNVYQTPSWGFDSEDFYNACIAVETFYTAREVLDLLLDIEIKLGRNRAADQKGYQARTIDLDILLSSEGIIKTEHLQVPHPAMQDRKFVLEPLVDIAENEVHPVYKKSIAKLLEEVNDDSQIEQVSEKIIPPKNAYKLSQFQYLTIEGNIGAGKTSLAQLISKEFNAKLILERFADNPFLPKFYEDMERYAFPLEMSFLADRYQRLQDDIASV